MQQIQACLDQWKSALPPGRLLPESEIPRYENNCLGVARRIIAVIQPECEEEIVTVIKTAHHYKLPLYTISTGHNWGYGSSLPVVNDCAILDLSRMNRILAFDDELGLITLEPGVTQQQLADYLAKYNLNFYVPTTGAGPSTSIIGNALEHGFGMTPIEDHFQAITSIRAVLADGSIYQSALTEMGAPQAGVWKWGVGPYLDGLFAQGNMGIVTTAQIALAPRPEHTEVFVLTIKRDNDLKPLLQACQSLLTHMNGIVGGLKLLNQAQLRATVAGEKLGMALPEEFSWLCIGVFRCERSLTWPVRMAIRSHLKRICSKLIFINDTRVRFMTTMFDAIPGNVGRKLRAQLQRAQHLMDIVNGVPRGLELRLVYHYVTMSDHLPTDPVRDGVGIVWYAPIIPLKIDTQLKMIAMISNVLRKYGFPETLSLTTVNDRCAIGVIPIIYKKPDGMQQAHQCFLELWKQGNALGCPPYRLNVEAMQKLTEGEAKQYWEQVAKIKTALDPNHILSPGRYART